MIGFVLFLVLAFPLNSPAQLPRDHDPTDRLVIQITKAGGYEGTAYIAHISSDDLSPSENDEIRGLIIDSNFFHLPAKISSSQRQCFDCGQITISIRQGDRSHTVFIDHDTAKSPPSFKPLEETLFRKACQQPEFRCPRSK